MICRNFRLKIAEWPQVKALCVKSTSLETIFFPVKEENRNQAHIDNNPPTCCVEINRDHFN